MTAMASNNVDDLRQEVSLWLERNWTLARAEAVAASTEERFAWARTVLKAGWAVPRWPAEWYGREFSNAEASIVERAFAQAGAPGAGEDRANIAANTLLSFGQEELKQRILAGLVTGEVSICLLYSEPGAGSDLAALRTRAERSGNEWLVNGQKVWTSGAQIADYGLLIARTDWDVPKHHGISFFFLPMKQPGVDIRPLRQITGDAHFNEVFLTDAIVPPDHLLGEENGGWRVLQAALAYERLLMGEGIGERRQGSVEDNRADLIALARETGCLDDRVIRQDIARAAAYRHLNDLNLERAKAESADGVISPIASLGKLAMSRILHEDARVMTTILGASSMLDVESSPAAADANYRAFNAYMTSIGGGTDQIQRNIIAERILGLPREPEMDRNIPFRASRAVTG